MNKNLTLEGKTIWITGGAGYLGSVVTRELDAQCDKVLCFDVPGKAEAFVKEHKLTRTVPIVLDVNDAAGLPAAVKSLVEQHGLPDGLAHLTFASSSGHHLETMPAEVFQQTLDRSLVPTFVLCRELAERMKVRGSGSIVLYSSMYGVVAPDMRIYQAPLTPNPIDYGAAKAAVLQMSRYLAVHYGPSNIRFNCITPGPFPNPGFQKTMPDFIQTLSRKTALNRIGQHGEIVGPTLFLLSDSASFVTGHSLAVDGGWTAW